MNIRRNARSRVLALAVVVMTAFTLMSVFLMFNAGAIDSSMRVASWGLSSSFDEPVLLDKGQVWAGKDVTSSDSDAGNGEFTFTYYAAGREYGDGGDLISGALVITDTFNDHYVFETDTANDKIIFKLNGAEKPALPDGAGNYTYYTDAQSERVDFNTNSNTVTYTIPAEALKTVEDENLNPSGADINKLMFRVVLSDSATEVKQYITNDDDSCSVEFTADTDNPYYFSVINTTNFTNTPGTHTVITPNKTWVSFIKGNLYSIKIFYDPDDDSKYYVFKSPQIGFDTETPGGPYAYIVGGEYSMPNGDRLIVRSSDAPGNYKLLPADDGNILITGAIWKILTDDDYQFSIDPMPNQNGDSVGVALLQGAPPVSYQGICMDYSSEPDTSWVFTQNIDDKTYIIMLVGNNLEIIEGQWIAERTDNGVYENPANSAYGYVNLTQKTQPNPVQRESVTIPTSTLNISKSVSGEGASVTEEFSMTVTFTPGGADNWNVLSIMPPAGAEGDNGVFTLSLSARDGIVSFTNVPVGTTYSITETISEAQDNAGWTAGTSIGLSGPVGTNDANAIVANEYTKQEVAGASDDGTTETPSPSPSAATGETGVKGDADILPQTGGISTSSLLGLLGLALVGVGGTTFVIFRKKFLSNSN